MKKYISPVVEVEYLDSLDIFTESGGSFNTSVDEDKLP